MTMSISQATTRRPVDAGCRAVTVGAASVGIAVGVVLTNPFWLVATTGGRTGAAMRAERAAPPVARAPVRPAAMGSGGTAARRTSQGGDGAPTRLRAAGSLRRHVRPVGPAPDGQDREPVQAARLRVPLRGDLRRLPVDLRLRARRRADAAQRQGLLVAHDGP